MIVKYDLHDIPATMSDKSNKNNKHYKLKKLLIEWLRDNSKIISVPVYYEKRTIQIANYGYEPDLCCSETGKDYVWLEIETDPFNIFTKLTNLIFLTKFNSVNLPSVLIFGIEEPHNEEKYLETFKEIRDLLSINSVMLFFIDIKGYKVKNIIDK